MGKSRKQAWLRDELILALDLYFRVGTDPPKADLAQLSDLLRALPVESDLAQNPSFRSPAAVNYKLANFVPFDPARTNKGLSQGGIVDGEVWAEFASDPPRLRQVADAIERSLGSVGVDDASSDDELVAEAPEGRLLTRLHVVRERSTKLVIRRKAEVLAETGRLACEVCGFDFAEVYGRRGAGFAECHHTVPVSELPENGRTRLADLAIICSNCHRMVHRSGPWMTLPELRALVRG